MSRDDPQLRIRLSPDLKTKIEERAYKNKRSLNAEVVARLEQSFLFENNIENTDIVFSNEQQLFKEVKELQEWKKTIEDKINIIFNKISDN